MTPSERAAMQKPEIGPVNLFYANQSLWMQPGQPMAMMQMETFENNEAALRRACELAKTQNFHTPFIALADDTTKDTYSTTELLEECSRRLSS
jgi:hypothetical protein